MASVLMMRSTGADLQRIFMRANGQEAGISPHLLDQVCRETQDGEGSCPRRVAAQIARLKALGG